MRDDSAPTPAFHTDAADDEAAIFPPYEHHHLVRPPERMRGWRIAALGAVGAGVLGVGLALFAPHGFPGAPEVAPAGKAELIHAAYDGPNYRPISGKYAPPDRERVLAAYRDVAHLNVDQGVGAVARASMDCFQKLARQPEYGLMDYCLALDAFGAETYTREAGESAPPSTYFGQGAVRRQEAVRRLTAGQTDANARLLDTYRLIREVAAAPPDVTPPPPPPPQPLVAAIEPLKPAGPVPAPAPAPAVPIKAAEVKPAAAAKPVVVAAAPPSPKPAPAPKAAAEAKPPKRQLAEKKAPPAPVAAKPKPVRLAKARPLPPPPAPKSRPARLAEARPLKAQPPAVKVRPAPKAAVLVQRQPAPKVGLPQPAIPTPARQIAEAPAPVPTCKARTRGERMVCEEPSLQVADRRMNAAYRRALDQADNPKALIAEQNRWLSLRDELAPDRGAVMSAYQDRIAELRRRGE